MLNMQRFPLPKYKLRLNQYSLSTLLAKDAFFNSFPIHAIHLLMPTSKSITDCEEALMLPDDTYFIVKNISTAALIQEAFIAHFVKNGSLFAFSHGAKAESDNFVTIMPSGKLIMSLKTAVADCLSLRKENHRNPKKKFRPSHQTYVIDMNSDDFVPGKKLYQAVLIELNKLEHIKFDLLLRWQPEGNVCSESIRSYFENRGFDCVVCEPSRRQHSFFTKLYPEIEFSMFDATMAENIVEWIGTQICEIEYSKDSDGFISNFTEASQQRNFKITSFKGFYTGVHISNLLKAIRTMFIIDPSIPYVAVSISGYQDCYITSNGYQKFSSDDKIICLIVSPVLDCWVVTLNT